MKYNKLYVYADAAVYPYATGLGVAVKDERGNLIAWRNKVMRAVRGSNEAEYYALLFALEQARTFSPQQVTVFSDNKLVVEQMRGYYRVRDEVLRGLHRQAVELTDKFERVVFVHISRERNGLADAMAEEAVQLSGKGNEGTRGNEGNEGVRESGSEEGTG